MEERVDMYVSQCDITDALWGTLGERIVVDTGHTVNVIVCSEQSDAFLRSLALSRAAAASGERAKTRVWLGFVENVHRFMPS